MESGAVGFLLKDAPAAQLAVTIRRIVAGERVADPELALSALSDGANPLTGRERDILRASLDGASIADIAALLYLSEGPFAITFPWRSKSSMYTIEWKPHILRKNVAGLGPFGLNVT